MKVNELKKEINLRQDDQVYIIAYDDQNEVLDSINIIEKYIQNRQGDVLARALNYLHANLSFNHGLDKVFGYEVIFPNKKV